MSQFPGDGLNVLQEEHLPVWAPLRVESLLDLCNEFGRGRDVHAQSVDDVSKDA